MVRWGIWVLAAWCGLQDARADDGAAWQQVGDARLNVSGCAIEAVDGAGRVASVVVVHDNKDSGEPRVGRVVTTDGVAAYKPLRWTGKGASIKDLEAITEVPDHPGHFIVLASDGTLQEIRIVGDKVRSHGRATRLPDPGPNVPDPNYEALRLVRTGSAISALWAERGEGTKHGTVFLGWWEPTTHALEVRLVIDVEVRYPEPDFTREVTDVAIGENREVWISSAWDNGDDDATYRSAVYGIGTLPDTDGGLVQADLPLALPALTFPDRKVEAMCAIPGATQLVIGSDDEHHGGWIFGL